MKNKSLITLLVLVLLLSFSMGAFANSTEFTDISGHWAETAIENMAAEGIIQGYPDGTFQPNNNVTRAEFAVMLYQATDNKDNPSVENPFVDVKASWYYDEVITLYEDGVIQGMTDNTFEPNTYITREQMIVLIQRAAETYGTFNLNIDETKSLSDFTDSDSISAYAKDSCLFAYQTGLIQGYDGKLLPKGLSTRAAVVTILDRCINSEKILPTSISQEDWVDAKQYVQLPDSIKMAYVEMGDPEGEPVILVHGVGDSSRTWSVFARYFTGFHVYILDLRGFGDSDKPDDRVYNSIFFASDINAFMNEMGLEKAHIVGHSMGSQAVQAFAFNYPEKVDKLVLVGSNYYYPSIDSGYFKFKDPNFDMTDPVWLDEFDSVTPGVLDGKPYEAEVNEMIQYIKKDTSNLPRTSLEYSFKANLVVTHELCLAEITAETLVIWGSEDHVTNQLTDGLTNCAGIIIYDGYGHSVQWENPVELADDIMKFLNDEENEKVMDSIPPEYLEDEAA